MHLFYSTQGPVLTQRQVLSWFIVMLSLHSHDDLKGRGDLSLSQVIFPCPLLSLFLPLPRAPSLYCSFLKPKGSSLRGEGNSKMWGEVAGATVRC